MGLSAAGALTVRSVAGAPDDLALTDDGYTTEARLDGHRVGYLHHQPVGHGEVVIHHLWVHTDHRERGVATRLMDAIVDAYPDDTWFRTLEFSAEGSAWAGAYEARTGIRIHDDSALTTPETWRDAP